MVEIIPPKDKATINLKVEKVPFGRNFIFEFRALDPPPEEAIWLNCIHALATRVGLKKSIRYLQIAENAGEEPAGWPEVDGG